MKLLDYSMKTIFLMVYVCIACVYFHKIQTSDTIFGHENNLPLKSLYSLKEGAARSKVNYYDVSYHGINTAHEFQIAQITRRGKSAYNYELLFASPLYYEIYQRVSNLLEHSKVYLLGMVLASFWMMSMVLTDNWKYRVLINCLFLANPFTLSAVIVLDVAIVEFFVIVLSIYLIVNWVTSHSIFNI